MKLSNTIVGAIEATDKEQVISDSEVTGLKLRVQKSGAKIFYLFWKHEGRQRKYRIAKWGDIGVPEARKVARKLRAEIALGNDPQAERTSAQEEAKRAKTGTLRVFLDTEYYKYAEKHQKTFEFTKGLLESHFDFLMNRQMDSIEWKEIDRWQTRMLADGIKPQSVNRKLVSLKAVLNKAVEWGVIKVSPLSGRGRLKEGDNNVVRWLSDAERVRLEKVLAGWKGYEAVVVSILLKTGCRPGEVFGLKWSDVDMENRLLTVRAGKTDSKQMLAINEGLMDVLNKWRKVQDEQKSAGVSVAGEGDYLFPSEADATGHIKSIRRGWNKIKLKAKLEDFRLYDCRHDCASRLVMAGVPIYTVAQVLGHSNVAMTQKYAHLAPDHLADAMKML